MQDLSASGGLNAAGPWLLIESQEGLWAANPDGSGLTQLTEVDYWNGSLQDAVQPGGDQVVFVSPGTYDFHNMTLNLLSLPDGNVTKLTDLTSAQTEPSAGSAPGDPGFEALRAVGEERSYAWSPDGSRLAFVGVMDGPSAEIYLYDTASGDVQRVSQDDAQNYGPAWSPDGSHLIYLGADGFGTGAGFDTTGVWSVRGDGSNVTKLYAPTGGSEAIDGWLDDTTALMHTWTPSCGPQNLRLFDIVSTHRAVLDEGCFTSAASDAWTGAALFSDDSGLYLLTAENRTPVQVGREPNARIEALGPDDHIFTVRFDLGGIITYGANEIDTQSSPVNAPADMLDVAVYGAIWGWTSVDDSQPGAWITGPGLEIGQIFPAQAVLPIWTENNNLLFFAPADSGGYDIYLTTFDSYYQDLAMVNHIDANIWNVIWLGTPPPGF
jgi:hypothetical protein